MMRLFCGPKLSIRTLVYTAASVSLMALLSLYYASGMGLSIFDKVSSSLLQCALRQKERHMILRMGCDATRSLRPNATLDYLIEHPKLLSHLIVNDDHKLLYCYIPKVSSTQWKKMMGVLAGTLPNVPLQQIPGSRPHERGVHRFLSDFSAPEIRRRLITYTSFLFVRHPLERLVSGYRNKFGKADLDAYFPKLFAAGIKARYRRGNATRSGTAPGETAPEQVTFDEFARWVSDPHPLNPLGARNEHWAPMMDQCHPCSIPYTIVGKMETLMEDARYVLNAANVSSISLTEGFHSRTHDIAGDMLASLSADVLKRVFRLYFEDFVTFGYHPSEVFSENRTADISTTIMFSSMFLQS